LAEIRSNCICSIIFRISYY